MTAMPLVKEQPSGENAHGEEINWNAAHPAFLILGKSAARQRVLLALVLVTSVALLVIGPSLYCFLDAGPAERADLYRKGAHSISEGNCHLCKDSEGSNSKVRDHHGDRKYVAEVHAAALSGLLMMIVTVVGGIGADVPGKKIFAMATSTLVAYSFSMGFGTFIVEFAKDEFRADQLRLEYNEVRNMPEEEVSEMVCHYQTRGLTEADARQVANILSKYEDFWVQHMMSEEIGVQLPVGLAEAAMSGIFSSASFLLFGAVPLVGIIVSTALGRSIGPQWYRPEFSTVISLAMSGALLTLMGFLASRIVGSRAPVANSILILANGCLASVVAFTLSQLASKVGNSSEETSVRKVPPASSMPPRRSLPSPTRRQDAVEDAQDVSGEVKKSPSSASVLAESTTVWPSIRQRFFHGLCLLWLCVCSVLGGAQVLERMSRECLRVFLYGSLTCLATGLGAAPFLLTKADAWSEASLAMTNALASGMMLAASLSMLMEAHDHCGPIDWQIFVGLSVGAIFIRASERLQGEGDDDDNLVVLHSAIMEREHFRKAMLIFTVMFFHSAAEGIAVGVSFSKQLREEFGFFVSALLSVHNVPEGLAVALVLVPRGVSISLASAIAILTSVPQPLLAVTAFLFVDSFQFLLPFGLAFAAGAMVYVCLHELLWEATEQLGWRIAAFATSVSFISMSIAIGLLHYYTGA